MFQNMDYIYEVYKEKSFSRAAKNLYLSQSSLSLTVKNAEKRIGMEIFDRSTNPIQLTEFGHQYIQATEEIRAIKNRLENFIYDTNNLKRGSLSVGAGYFFATYLIPSAISVLWERCPNIAVTLVEGRSLDLSEALNKGSIDVLITNDSLDPALFDGTPLFQERMVLVVPKCFFPTPPCPKALITQDILRDPARLEALPGADLEEFMDIAFVGLRPGNSSRQRWEELFASAGRQPRLLLEVDQSYTAFSMAVSGIGACIVGDTIAKQVGIGEDLWLYKLTGPGSVRQVMAYTKSRVYVSRVMDAFLSILADQHRSI